MTISCSTSPGTAGLACARPLRRAPADNLFFAAADALLNRCAEMARRATPFAFFAWLLGPELGRRRMFARLGVEAADALEEFLELALDYERQEPPSLQGFLAWLRSAEAVVKRDMEIGRDEVRVMTVHGAKGLEAPVVILADTTTPPAGAHAPGLLAVPRPRTAPETPPCLVWPGRKKDDVAAVATARGRGEADAEDEHRRLLYVAMTRAAERLIVCGCQGVMHRPAGCWYDLIVEGLAGMPGFEEIGEGDARVWRYRVAPDLSSPHWVRRTCVRWTWATHRPGLRRASDDGRPG